ncbi:50S ribosomal protein L6 [Candidatus Johnevansia muelleri]|uniref:Large ribosomal subunit protein uL6 n=1 Tax=Candidatus Johnevansia muelleri TaxID=1495769 RepID=A0A078KEC8_9GAMM|nr:50S ribosomal protein L6 [Candidatus Evansia muelleri]
MSRIAKKPINIPKDIEVTINKEQIIVKGNKGELKIKIKNDVFVSKNNNKLIFNTSSSSKNWAIVGTTRALVNNMIIGVSNGFSRSLEIIGVGYRVNVCNGIINLNIGFSHAIEYKLPKGITAETPSNTTIVLNGANNQKLGQVASEIRGLRSPDPYKGKGIRYMNEIIRCKEAKKK